MTHEDRAREFLDRVGRELPTPAEEIELLAGLLAEVERGALERAAGECRKRAEAGRYTQTMVWPDGRKVRQRLGDTASIALDAAATAIERLAAADTPAEECAGGKK